MHLLFPQVIRKKNPYSARHMAKPVKFYCRAAEAASVCIIGDFNHWNPHANPLQRNPDGVWSIELPLTHGHHQYLFVVDGRPTPDPRASGTARTRLHERVSIIAVS